MLLAAAPIYGDPLTDARQAWNQGDQSRAAAHYGAIGFDSPQWPEKLRDAFAIQISENNPTEAWRILAIARRLEVPWPDWDYSEAMAAALGGSCTLNRTIANRVFGKLLSAHTYRYSHKFANPSELNPQDLLREGRLSHSLAVQQAPLLRDIPRTQLVTGRGCRYWPYDLRANDQAEAGEFEALRDWYGEWKADHPLTRITGSGNVITRLLVLAHKRKEVDLTKEVLAPFAKLDAAGWGNINDEERRYLWYVLMDSGNFPKPPFLPDSSHTKMIKTIVFSHKGYNAGDWLGLIDYRGLPLVEQTSLMNHLESLPENRYSAEVNLEKSRLFYLQGRFPESLHYIRRILILGENDGADRTEMALHLATLILNEFGFDERLQGAMQSSIPTSYWKTVYQNLFIEASLAGDRRGMSFVLKHAGSGRGSDQKLFTTWEQDLLLAMGNRSLESYNKNLAAWKTKRRLGSKEMRFVESLVSRTLAYDQQRYQTVAPFMRSLADVLEVFLKKGGEQQSHLEEMYHALRRGQTGAWSEGSQLVRQGTVQAGVVNINVPLNWPNPFVWRTPMLPPRRDLLPVPAGPGQSGWVIR